MTTLSGLDRFRDMLATEVGAVPVSRCRAVDGSSFALGAADADLLGGLLPALDDVSLSCLVRGFERGGLTDRSAVAG